MNAIKPLSVTAETVTRARSDYEALLHELEEAHDLARIRQVDADLAAGRTEFIPLEMALALCAGANRVRSWRKHRGMTARDLAAQVGIAPGYLSEIETGKKAGSVQVLTRIAGALEDDLDDLVGEMRAE